MIKNTIIILLFVLSLVQTDIILKQETAIDKLDRTLTQVVFICTGAYIPTIEEKNNGFYGKDDQFYKNSYDRRKNGGL